MENKTKIGKVKAYKSDKGYGFITDSETLTDFFFHYNSCHNYSFIQPGDKVTFEIVNSVKRLGSFEAANVQLIKK